MAALVGILWPAPRLGLFFKLVAVALCEGDAREAEGGEGALNSLLHSYANLNIT